MTQLPSSRLPKSQYYQNRKMSDNSSPAVNTADSDSVDPKDMAPGPQTLLRLPTELIDTLAEFIDCQCDLLTLRATCRTLRDATALQVCKSFFSPMSTSGSSKSVRLLTTRLTSPNLPHAQRMARHLIVSAPEYKRGPYKLPERFEQPSIEEVARLLTALPNLDHMRVTDGRDTASQIHVLKSAHLFLACMTKPSIRPTIKLGCLGLRKRSSGRIYAHRYARVTEGQSARCAVLESYRNRKEYMATYPGSSTMR